MGVNMLFDVVNESCYVSTWRLHLHVMARPFYDALIRKGA